MLDFGFSGFSSVRAPQVPFERHTPMASLGSLPGNEECCSALLAAELFSRLSVLSVKKCSRQNGHTLPFDEFLADDRPRPSFGFILHGVGKLHAIFRPAAEQPSIGLDVLGVEMSRISRMPQHQQDSG
jgi:hypothetical protein